MHPVDHVVANVHRVGVRRQHLDLKRVAKTSGLKRLIPPRSTFDQRVLNIFWRAAIDVINDRFDGLAYGGIRVFFLKPMAFDPAFFEVFVNIRTVVVKADRDHTDTRVKLARFEFVIRQLDQRGALADRNVAARRCDLIDKVIRFAGGRKRDGRLDLGVFRKAFCVRQIQGTAALVKAVVALSCLIDPVADAVRVADQEVGRVHQNAVALGGLHLKAPDNGFCKRFLDRAFLSRVVAQRAEFVIWLHQQNLIRRPLKLDDLSRSQLTTIEPQRVRTDARRQRNEI